MAHPSSDPVKRQQLRAEYTGRINHVIDYIQTHLSEPLKLEELARVASFSPYHFHRIFGAMVGETLNQFVSRLRVERAATRLIADRTASITEVALDCGYSSSATFARAFRDAFGMTPSEWRTGGAEERKNRKTESNGGQPDSKVREACRIVSVDYDSTTNTTVWRIQMKKSQKPSIKAQIEVRELPELTVAYVRHVGPYAGNSEMFAGLFGKLMQWAGPRGLIRPPESQILSVYHDDPNVTDEAKLRVDACLSVPPDTQVEGEVGKTTIAGGKFAVGHFELRDDQYSEAWEALMGGWLPESGYQPDDRPCYELYLNDPKEHPENKCVVDICVPVRPL